MLSLSYRAGRRMVRAPQADGTSVHLSATYFAVGT